MITVTPLTSHLSSWQKDFAEAITDPAELGRIIVDVSFNREAVVQGARAQPGRVVQRRFLLFVRFF